MYSIIFKTGLVKKYTAKLLNRIVVLKMNQQILYDVESIGDETVKRLPQIMFSLK